MRPEDSSSGTPPSASSSESSGAWESGSNAVGAAMEARWPAQREEPAGAADLISPRYLDLAPPRPVEDLAAILRSTPRVVNGSRRQWLLYDIHPQDQRRASAPADPNTAAKRAAHALIAGGEDALAGVVDGAL